MPWKTCSHHCGNPKPLTIQYLLLTCLPSHRSLPANMQITHLVTKPRCLFLCKIVSPPLRILFGLSYPFNLSKHFASFRERWKFKFLKFYGLCICIQTQRLKKIQNGYSLTEQKKKIKSDNFQKHIPTVASQTCTSTDKEKIKPDSFNLKSLVSQQRGQFAKKNIRELLSVPVGCIESSAKSLH